MLFCKRFNSMLYSSFGQSFDNNYVRLSRVLFHFKDFNFKPNLSIVKQNFCQNTYIYNNLNLVQIKYFSNDSQSNQKCWKCDHMFDIKDNDSKVILLCDKCQTIQALNQNFNYFQLFGIKNTFQINLSDLNKCFKSLQMQTHPDKFAKKSQRERQYSMDNSSFINKAYKTLRDPYERGQYLLEILFDSSIKENETAVETQFLNEIMKLYEDIASDDASQQDLVNILHHNEENVKNVINEISIAFETRNIIKAKELLTKLKFYESAALRLKEMLQKSA